MSKIEKKKYHRFSIGDTTFGLLQKYKNYKKEVEFIVETDGYLPDVYDGDSQLISEVLSAMIENAFSHTPEGLVYLRLSGTIEEAVASLTFSVSDTGVGIPAERVNESLLVGKDLSIINSQLMGLSSSLNIKSVYGIGTKLFFEIKLSVLDKTTIDEKRAKNMPHIRANTGANASALPEVDGVKWAKAFENMPDEDIIITLAKEFYRGANKEITALCAFYSEYNLNQDEGALDNYRIKVHALKNSAALIGAMELSEKARNLEFASRDKDFDFVKVNHNSFVHEYLRIAGDLAEGFGESLEELASQTIESDRLLCVLGELRIAMENVDIEKLNERMEELEAYEYSEEIAPHIKAMSESALSLDENQFFAAIDAIEGIL